MAVRRWWCWAAVDVGGRSSPFPDGGGGFGGGHCKKRAVVMCDITFVTSPDWDVSNCLSVSLLPLFCDTVSPFSFLGVCRCWYILTLQMMNPTGYAGKRPLFSASH